MRNIFSDSENLSSNSKIMCAAGLIGMCFSLGSIFTTASITQRVSDGDVILAHTPSLDTNTVDINLSEESLSVTRQLAPEIYTACAGLVFSAALTAPALLSNLKKRSHGCGD